MKIAIDIGHNCSPDLGAVGIGNENTMNMDTGQKVIAKLRALGHEVIEVTPVSCSSVSDSLAQRVNKANFLKVDLYVSIHFNAGGGHGVEVWIGSEKSRDTATRITSDIAALGFRNRGVKVQGRDGHKLYVLNNTAMPALLVEGCFVDSQEDMNRYNAEDMANAIVKGIIGESASNLKEEKKKVKNIVVYSNEIDKRAAEYLADYLQCPIISNSTPFDYSVVENTYAVGGGEFTGYAKVIKGADRYETIKAVLQFIGK